MSVVPAFSLFVSGALLIIISLVLIVIILLIIAHNDSPLFDDNLLYHFRPAYSMLSTANIQLSMFKIVAAGVEPARPKQGSTIFESANSTR